MINKIKERREEMGMSQLELAEKIGVDASSVCLWENGKREPKFTSVMRMARIFNCSPDQIINIGQDS